MSARTAVRYEEDFYTWSQEQAAALRRAAAVRVNLPDAIDFVNVAEEIESLGASQLRELYSRYRVLLLHLLKWQYQPERRSRSWQSTIATQRDELARLLEMSPGLKPKRKAELARAYKGARTAAAIETGLPVERFPELCPYTLEEVENPAW
jgi:transposase